MREGGRKEGSEGVREGGMIKVLRFVSGLW